MTCIIEWWRLYLRFHVVYIYFSKIFIVIKKLLVCKYFIKS